MLLDEQFALWIEQHSAKHVIPRYTLYLVNVMVFLDLTKDLQRMGDDVWNRSWMKSNSFGAKHDILVPKMTECYIPGKSKCRPSSITF